MSGKYKTEHLFMRSSDALIGFASTYNSYRYDGSIFKRTTLEFDSDYYSRTTVRHQGFILAILALCQDMTTFRYIFDEIKRARCYSDLAKYIRKDDWKRVIDSHNINGMGD